MDAQKKCSQKVKHISLQAALDAVDIMQKNTGYINRVFKCRVCGFYHIGRPTHRMDPYVYSRNLSLSEKYKRKGIRA